MLRFARATDGGAIFRRETTANDAVAPAGFSYSFWNLFTLQFPTRSTETRYGREAYSTFLEHDLLAHFIGCFPGPFFVYNLGHVLPIWFTILWLLLSLVYAPTNIWLRAYHTYASTLAVVGAASVAVSVLREYYMRVRMSSVVFVRFVIPFCFLGFGIYDSPPLAKLSAVVMTICTKSPVSNMLFSSMNLRLLFHQHLILHTVALFVAYLWIPGFCTTCLSEPTVIEKFNDVDGISYLTVSKTVCVV